MNEQIASPALRYLIRDVLTGTGNPQSLANVNTTELPNGALCMVATDGTLWRLDKTSSIAPSGEAVAPGSGPGRWLLFEVGAFSSPPVGVNGSGSNGFPVGGSWGQPSTNSFAIQQIAGNLNSWALTASGGILTYTGPTRQFAVALYATLNVGDATAARQVFLGISHNDDLTGVAAADGNNISDVHATAVDHPISTGRIVRLVSGDTLRPKGAAATAAVSLTATSYRMIVTPA
jgi:hypothetical protein